MLVSLPSHVEMEQPSDPNPSFAVLVRRVVEARRIHAMGTSSAAARTAPLPPKKERMPDHDEDGASVPGKKSFWSKLKCW